ncbi:MAG: hypothetical protein VB012_00360 [Erysipelotrichaceae bacterium]|nr:hypothetical protein [Erysipelotrichaceae bacterium]
MTKKSLFIIILSLLMLTCVGCAASENDSVTDGADTVTPADDFNADEITVEKVDYYRILIKITANEQVTYYTILKGSTGWVYLVGTADGSTGYMYADEGNKYYFVDTASQLLTLLSEGDSQLADTETVDDIFSAFLMDYSAYTADFTKVGSDMVIGRNCLVYEFTFTENNATVTALYYLDEQIGIALKYQIESVSNGSTDLVSWEVTELSVNDQDLQPYLDWPVELNK